MRGWRRRTVPRRRLKTGGQDSALEQILLAQLRFVPAVPAPVTQYRFALGLTPPRQWRFDVAWPPFKVAAEIQGGIWMQGKHSRGAGQENDAEKLSAAAILGWRVLILTDRFITNGLALRWIEQALSPEAQS